MTVNKILHITTEGDVEGRSTKSLGYFNGTPKQAIAWLAANGITPYYRYHIREVEIDDVDDLNVGTYKVEVDSAGYVTQFTGKLPETLKKQAKIRKLLKGLSNDDKELLEEHYACQDCNF